MGNRSLLCGAATVEVDIRRYDELVRKEERLNVIETMIKKECSSKEIFNFLMCDEEVKGE